MIKIKKNQFCNNLWKTLYITYYKIMITKCKGNF